MLATVGQPLRKARTATVGPCRAHTVFGPTCVSIIAIAMRAGSTAQSPATLQRDGLPSAADPRTHSVRGSPGMGAPSEASSASASLRVRPPAMPRSA